MKQVERAAQKVTSGLRSKMVIALSFGLRAEVPMLEAVNFRDCRGIGLPVILIFDSKQYRLHRRESKTTMTT